MRAIRRRLEHDPCLRKARIQVVLIVLAEDVRVDVVVGGGRGARGDFACCGLEFAGGLPFGAFGEPEHEPVVGVVFFGEVGG